MLKTLLLICAAIYLVFAPADALAGHYSDNGTYVGRPSAAVTSLFSTFPDGGPVLADAVEQLLINNPGLADDVAFVATNSGNADQLAAAGLGMARAESVLTNAKEQGAAERIARAARASGNPVLIATAGGFSGSTGGFAGGIFLPANNSTTSNTSQNCTTVTTPGDNTVSPAIPPTSTTTCR